jgi:hypothetical protein
VRADGSEAMTEPDGFFDLPEVILPPSGRVNVSFKKEGFATAQEALAAVPGERYVLDARLKPVDTAQEVDAQQDAMIMVIDDQGREKAMLELSAGSLIDASGNPVSGPATVEMTHGDPTQEIDIFPGEFEAAEGGSETPTMDLESFAFGEVSFMDDSGTELNQLDPQKPAILTLRLPDAFQTGGVRGGELKPGDTIPWWSYDETNGVWVQEDAEPTTPGMDDATVIADESGALFSQAGIVHASWWNSDKPISQSACLSVTVKTPQGSLVQGVRARAVGITYFGGSYAHSGADGRANFKVKRSDEITEMVRVFVRRGYWGKGIPDPALELATPSTESSLPDISACRAVEIIMEIEPFLQINEGTLAQGSRRFLGDGFKTNIGSVIYINDNDSDEDGKFDFEDDDGVAGERDMAFMRMELKPAGARIIDGKALLSFDSDSNGASKVRLWESELKEPGTEVSLPAEFDLSDLPKALWVEGIQGSETPRDVRFRLELLGQGGTGGLTSPPLEDPPADRVVATVLEIKSVRFVGKGNSLDKDNHLDRDEHPNASPEDYADETPKFMRVFPGARIDRVIGGKATLGNARDTVEV